MNEEICPCCNNHCRKDELKCGRGRAYFGKTEEGGSAEHGKRFADEEEGVTLLRRCGHLLHHGGVTDILGALDEEEKKTLTRLLKKCLGE